MEQELDLSRCPFCGGKASLKYRTNTEYGLRHYFVKCHICKAQTGLFSNAEDASDAWNMRRWTVRRDNEEVVV